MAANASTVKVTFLGDANQLNRVAKGVSDNTSSMSDKFKKFGKVAAVAVAAASAAVGVVAVKLFDHGAQLEAMGNKAKTVFGDQIDTVSKWAKANAAGMGLTSRELTGLSADFGDLLIPMGFTREQAAAMSTDVVGLAGALSQWSGGTVSAADASRTLAKAMLGEREELKSLGISITDADVKARLLKNGTDQLTGSALEQAKATATQQLIFEKSTDAQAAYKAGSNKLLTAQNELKSKMKELYDEAAVRLIPVFTDIAAFVVDRLIPAFEKMWKDHGPKVKEAFAAVRDAMKELADKIKDGADKIIENWDDIVSTAKIAAAALSPIFAALIVHWAAVATAATISAVKQAAAWVVTQVAAGVAAIAHGVAVVAMIAGWAAMAARATFYAGVMATAWLIGLGPIGWGIIALAAIGAAMVVLWQKSETFRDIVTGALKLVIKYIDFMLGGWEMLFRALSKVPGFGWAKDAADLIGKARDAADGLTRSINGIPPYKRVTVDYQQVASVTNVPHSARAHGGPVLPGRPYLVGERGPEMIVPKAAGTVMNASRTKAALGGGGDGMTREQAERLIAGVDFLASLTSRETDRRLLLARTGAL